jgi:hypothetical protein
MFTSFRTVLGFALSVGVLWAFTAQPTAASDQRASDVALAIGEPVACVGAAMAARAQGALATIAQRDRENQDSTIRLRTWGKLIKVGILGVILTCGGGIWLYNKLKPQ